MYRDNSDEEEVHIRCIPHTSAFSRDLNSRSALNGILYCVMYQRRSVSYQLLTGIRISYHYAVCNQDKSEHNRKLFFERVCELLEYWSMSLYHSGLNLTAFNLS